jgi:hypothetical protein
MQPKKRTRKRKNVTSEIYYPNQRHLLGRTTIRRDRALPDNMLGEVLVQSGMRVGLRDVVARGAAPTPYMLIEAARFFNLRDPDKLFDLLGVRIGEEITEGTVLAARGGKRLLSPIGGEVVDITQGLIVLREHAPTIELEAGVNGTVVGVRKSHGVIVEAYGAVLQGVWGNGRRAIGTIHLEPSAGMENIYGSMIDTQFRGAILITRRPLRAVSFQVIEDQGFNAVIAPSMEPDVLELAMQSDAAILLTEGFGSQRMSNAIAQFAEAVDGRQATVDAVLPSALETREPEVLISVPLNPGERPPLPNQMTPLKLDREVRIVGGASAGMVGHIIGLPKEPVLLDNGLRVPCAEVELVTGERLDVPLANIEVSG